MKAEENIKIELIEWLNGLKDKHLLATLLQLKQSTDNKDWDDNLSDAQMKSLENGLSDEKNNRLIKSSDFWKKYGKKL